MIEDLTIRRALDGLARQQWSATDLVEDLLRTIHKRDSEIRAYLWVDEEDAIHQAREADARRARGESGALLGIPLAVKDILNVRDQPCTCASRILEGYRAPYDATAIARLRAEGALLVGRTNMDEFGMGSTTENSAYQITRNPWSHDHVPGGSSGGSAAAVAAGEALAALGSDTGGSVRLPAAFCGCVGLKPSYGRISRYGLTAYASSLDQIGTLTRTVEDAALLLRTMAGYDPRDATSVPAPVPDYVAELNGDLRGLRLGLPQEYFTFGLDPEVESVVRTAAETWCRLGVELIDIRLPHTEYAVAAYYILATAEASANLARFDGVRYGRRAAQPRDLFDLYTRTRAEGFGREVKRRILLGTFVLSSGYYEAYYRAAQKVRTLIRRDFDAAFSQCHALVTPVAPTPAYRIGEKAWDPLRMYLGDIFTVTANLAGLNALALPCGWSSSGLPIALQIIAPAFEEARLLRLGHAFEQARGPWPVARGHPPP